MPHAPIYRLTYLSVFNQSWSCFFLFFLGFPFSGKSAGLEIPLTIRETAGVPRHQWLITTGVPLPQGAVRSLEKLQIMDAQGRFIPAQFNVASRWWVDGSIRWVHCDFAASVGARSIVTYYLREVASLPEFPSPIGLRPRGRDFEIITGPLRMVLLGNSNQLLDQVWVDEGWGYDFSETNKILESGNFQLTLTCDDRTYHAGDWKNRNIEVESVNALRAVIKISGSFVLAEQKEKKLDYLARITLYGGKTYFKLDLTVFDENLISPGSTRLLQDLAISLKLNLDPSHLRFSFGGTGEDYHGDFHQQAMSSIYQMTSSQFRLLGAIEGNGIVDDSRATNLGWVDLADEELGLSVSLRWFSRLFPKGFEVRDDGTLTIKLFPSLAPPLKLPKGFCRTHELLFHFHGKRDFASGQVRNNLLGFQSPLQATGPPSSYISDFMGPTDLNRRSGRDSEFPTPNFVSKLDAWLLRNRDTISANMRERDVGEGSGLLCFGDSLHLLRNQEPLEPRGDWQQTVGDFSHALYLNFIRTGDLRSLELAEQTVAFTADFIRTHEGPDAKEGIGGIRQAVFPSQPGSHTGIERFYQIEGLLDSYLLTGCPRSLEAAKKSLQELLREDKISLIHDPATLGNILLCLTRGYEVLGDQRFLNRLNQFVDAFITWQKGNQYNQKENIIEAWKYGILWDGLLKGGQITGQKVFLGQIKDEVISLLSREADWNVESKRLRRYPQLTFLLARGFASIDQDKQDFTYRDLGIECLKSLDEGNFTLEEPGTFGLIVVEAEKLLSLIEFERLKGEHDREIKP